MPTQPARTFVPTTLDTSSFTAIEPLFLALEDRPLTSRPDLERWLLDWTELRAASTKNPPSATSP